MASTGWKEWKKKDMTADSVDELPTTTSEPDRAPSAGHDAPPAAEDWHRIADANGAFRRAVESTTDLVTFHARGGHIIFANRAARVVIGVGADDPLPRVDLDQFFDTTPAQLAEMRQSIIDHGQWSGELDVRGVDVRIPASVVISGHRDENGRYEYFSALSRDITERRGERRGPAPQRSRTPIDCAIVAAANLGGRCRRNRPRLEPLE